MIGGTGQRVDVGEECNDEDNSFWFFRDANNKGVATFIPKVLSKVDKVRTETIEHYVRLSLEFNGDEVTTVLAPLKEIEQVNWPDYDQRCILNQKYPKVGIYIGNVIRKNVNNAVTETIYVWERLGIHFINNIPIFAAGDRIIFRSPCNDEEPKIELKDLGFRLDINPNLSKEEAFEGVMDLINLSPEIGSVLVAHVISGIIRRAFKEAGFKPSTVLVVAGESGMLKSSYVPQLTQLYNRADQIKAETRFNSTTRFIEDMLYEYSECTVVIDDLHTAESKEIKKRNAVTAEEILRRISDDTGRGHKEGSSLIQKEFRGNVVFIQEYVSGKESSIPRALVVNLTKRPDGNILDKYQRRLSLHVSTFYSFFIQWYVENFEDIRDEIDVRLSKFREATTDSAIHGRLRDTQFYMQISFMFFLEFCRESGFISSDYAAEQYCSFASYMSELIRVQQDRFRPSKDFEERDYLKFISELYKNDKFCLADDAETFREKKHDGLIHQKCLCLRREKLERKVQEFLPDVQIDEVVKFLVDRQALKMGKDKRTIKISAMNKREGALRFYAIKLNMLE